jgi:hypothetical protein
MEVHVIVPSIRYAKWYAVMWMVVTLVHECVFRRLALALSFSNKQRANTSEKKDDHGRVDRQCTVYGEEDATNERCEHPAAVNVD